MGIPVILLRLEGPLQSWGERSHWDWRDTAEFPTKSGLVGLLSCALGYERTDARIRELSDQLRVAVRCDRAGIMTVDYHTVTAEVMRNAEGKARSSGNTIVSHRQYLQDASFLAAVTGPGELCERIDRAMKKPRWPVFLGRKSCVPSTPVYRGLTCEFSSLLEALGSAPVSGREQEPPERLPCETEDEVPGVVYRRSDQVADAAKHRFTARTVSRISLKREDGRYVPEQGRA